MEYDIGDIINYKANNTLDLKMLILEVMPEESAFGIKYKVLMLDSGQPNYWVFYPVDRLYVTKVA